MSAGLSGPRRAAIAAAVGAESGADPLSLERLAEIAARVSAAEGGWHVVPDEAEPHCFEIHGDGPTVVAVFGGDSYPVRENAEFAAHARQDVPVLLAEVERLLSERHSTNEAVSDAAEALRVKDAAAELVAEYRVPTRDGKWLSVRREPKGDRWLIAQSFGHSPMRVWTGERWTSWGLAATAELWAYASADAALTEATRLATLTGDAS